MTERDRQRLAAYLAPRHSSFEVASMRGGHSNLTYLVRADGLEFVLRRPPHGPLPPKAHDVAREYRRLVAINRVFPLAPQPLLLCEDLDVIGAPFFTMERRTGIVIGTDGDGPAATKRECDRGRQAWALVDALARLHAIDARQHATARLGEPTGFITRQMFGWIERWRLSRSRDLDDMDAVGSWLAGRIPPAPARPAVVHGDYKLDNVMLDAADTTRLSAVLDWELTALGEPLVDLAVLLAYWPPTPEAGWPAADEIVHRYATATGANVSTLPYYEVFALFRSAVIVQQLAVRSRRAGDAERARTLEDRVAGYARRARGLISEAGSSPRRSRAAAIRRWSATCRRRTPR